MSSSSASSAAAGPSEEFKRQLDLLQALVKRTRDLVATQQQFEAQAHENSMVQEELDNVAEGPTACVYKLSARVLVRQDLTDAKATVKSRLELIAKGARDTEAAIKRAMAEQDELRAKLQVLQRAQQQQLQQQPQEA
jgi:chaperonin cofactor prefoldin